MKINNHITPVSHLATRVGLALIVACIAATSPTQVLAHEGRHGGDQDTDDGPPIEPKAGSWRTLVISSGKDYRVPRPPGHRETKEELKALKTLISQNDAQAQQQIELLGRGLPGLSLD